VRVPLASMPSVSGSPVVGDPGILYGLDLRAHGVRYQARVQRVPGPDFDAGGGASFGLFRFDRSLGIWTRLGSLRGGYGTTGQEVVFSIPLRHVGLARGGRAGGVRAFSAVGTYAAGPTLVLDRVRVA